MGKIRVMIVEDDPVWMRCINDIINKEEDMSVVNKATTKDEAIEVNVEEVDIVLLDLTLLEDGEENLNGLNVASELNHKGLKKIIMLTSWEEKDIILESFDKGAINYVTKSSYRDIPRMVRDAYYGKVSIHSDASTVLVDGLRSERKLGVLTTSEREVYKLKEKGFNRNQIAKKLFKSVKTIKKHIKTINSKIK